jgi:hypothetical protein
VAFYFGSYLDMHDTAIYALFMWQPLILVALIPALSMRIWTEEYKSGTDEFLLTLPLSDSVLVLAKWAAVFSLLSLMALGLLPFILYTASRLHLDFYNIMSNFIGLELMMMTLSSLGCLISSLSRQLGELLADAKKPSSEIISNLKVLMMSSRNRDNTNFLEANYEKWNIFFEIMKNYVIINSGDIKHE